MIGSYTNAAQIVARKNSDEYLLVINGLYSLSPVIALTHVKINSCVASSIQQYAHTLASMMGSCIPCKSTNQSIMLRSDDF